MRRYPDSLRADPTHEGSGASPGEREDTSALTLARSLQRQRIGRGELSPAWGLCTLRTLSLARSVKCTIPSCVRSGHLRFPRCLLAHQSRRAALETDGPPRVLPVWTLHLAAAKAYRDGHKAAAGTITDCRRCRTRVVAARLTGRIALTAMCGRRTAAPPKRERSGKGRLGDFFVPGMNQFFSVTRKVFEPHVYSLRTLVKSCG